MCVCTGKHPDLVDTGYWALVISDERGQGTSISTLSEYQSKAFRQNHRLSATAKTRVSPRSTRAPTSPTTSTPRADMHFFTRVHRHLSRKPIAADVAKGLVFRRNGLVGVKHVPARSQAVDQRCPADHGASRRRNTVPVIRLLPALCVYRWLIPETGHRAPLEDPLLRIC